MWEITRVGEDVEKIETLYIKKLKLERPSEPLLGGSKERKKIKKEKKENQDLGERSPLLCSVHHYSQ